MNFYTMLNLICLLLIFVSCSGIRTPEVTQYTFSRKFEKGSALEPRGGTTTGPAVNLDKKPSIAWATLQEEGISKFERDRRAILAMAGDYRSTFEFIETVSFPAAYTKDRPYQSWATERIYVLEDKGDFISLQHIMVMFFLEDGKITGPAVIKHWRQDWTYEPKGYHQYKGNNTWKRYTPSEAERKGAWVQEVFNVDDSPRYASVGRWEHTKDFSTWTGSNTYRPLPRREYSVRSDYDVLEGINRHIIIPTGWVHEQENLKVSLKSEGEKRYIARELGLNSYERIVGFDFSSGDEYWEKSKDYWSAVRKVWRSLFDANATLMFNANRDGESLIGKHFDFVEKYNGGSSPDELFRQASSIISPHVQVNSTKELPVY